MCQLTLFDVNSPNIFSKSILTNFLRINSLEHPHGWGVYGFKTNMIAKGFSPAYNDDNLASEIGKVFPKRTNTSCMMHVRRASSMINYDVKDSIFNQPTVMGNYIFAHNGTVTLDKKITRPGEILIDSQELAILFDMCMPETGITVEAIKEFIKQFSGTFALMIHDLRKPDEVWFIKDDKRTLFFMECTDLENNRLGTIFNTELNMLYIFRGYLESFYPKIMFSTIFKLEDNAIYKYTLTKDLERVGNFTQKYSYIPAKTTPGMTTTSTTSTVITPKGTTTNDNFSTTDNLTELYSLALAYGERLYSLCWYILGKNIFSITPDDLLELKFAISFLSTGEC